jgi:hypothetical protein
VVLFWPSKGEESTGGEEKQEEKTRKGQEVEKEQEKTRKRHKNLLRMTVGAMADPATSVHRE